MHELIERIVALQLSVDTCVCAGIGSTELAEELLSLRPARLVLLEGNPDIAAQLTEKARRWRGVEVQGLVVAPYRGAVTWYTHNLPAFDGPLDAAPLHRFFPRLGRKGEIRREAEAFADWLESLRLQPAAPGLVNVLILSLPGQEVGLLRASSPQLLDSFDAVVVNGCSDAAYAGASAMRDVLSTLQDLGFAPSELTGQDQLWPTAVAQIDRKQWKLTKLEQRVRELEATIVDQTASRDHQLALVRQALEVAERRATELYAQIQEAGEGRARAEKEAQQCQAQHVVALEAKAAAEQLAIERLSNLQVLEQRQREAERAVSERQSEFSEALQQHAAAQQLAEDRLAQLDSLARSKATLEVSVADLASRLEQASESLAAMERLAEDRLSLLDTLIAAKAAAEIAATELRDLVRQSTEEKAIAERLAHDRQAQIDVLVSAKLEAEARAAEALTRAEQLAAERFELENKLNLLGNELAQERAAHQGAEELALEFGGKLKEAMERCDARSAEVAELQRQLEQTRRQLQTERSADRRQVGDLEVQSQRVAQLEAELRDNRRALNVAVRTQALREQDLRDLQERYAAMQREQDASQELVTRLAERLSVAQRYFDQLTAEGASRAHASLVAAPVGGSARPVRARKQSKVKAIALPQTTGLAAQESTGFDAPAPTVDRAARAPAPGSETGPVRRRRGKKAVAPTTG
jgi:hypothetical protein